MFKTKSMAIKVTTSVVKCLKNVFGIDISEEYYLKETSYSARFFERRKLQLYEWKFSWKCVSEFSVELHTWSSVTMNEQIIHSML